MKLLEGKVAIVTGAARGIGEGIVLKFAEHGAHVAFTYVSDSSADKAKGLEEVDPMDFLDIMSEKLKLVEIDESMLQRSVNSGFSGGEKKRNEILQMAVLEPRLAILDETDSGLDIDALRVVADGVNKLRRKDNATIVVTHYQRLLNYIVPDYVHVLANGRILKSGGKDLALELEDKGYDWVTSGSPVGAGAARVGA